MIELVIALALVSITVFLAVVLIEQYAVRDPIYLPDPCGDCDDQEPL